MATTYNSDGSLTGTANSVQPLVNGAVSGDTVTIPPGTFTWNAPLTITGKNIKLVGNTSGTISSGTLPKIVAGASVARLIDFTLEDTSNFTAEIGKLHFDGTVTDHKILLHGATTVRLVGGQYISGIRVHDCRFTIPYYTLSDTTMTASTTVGTNVVTVTGYTPQSTDVNRAVFCNNVPTGSYVASVSGSTITLGNPVSANATATASGLALTLAGKTDIHGSATFQNNNSGWIECEDWVEGVVDHCEVDYNTMRYQASFGLINHNTSPTNTGNYGDYAFFYRPNGPSNPNMAGTLHAMYFEDCIIKAGCGAFTDTGSTSTGGGGIIVSRHNISIASNAMHGCRESSGRKRGGRLIENYSNIFCILTDALQARISTGIVEHRDGELVCYKNYLQAQTGQSVNSGAIQNITKSSAYCTSSNNNGNVLDGGPDALDRWDENRTGSFTDSVSGVAWSPLTSYTHTQTDTGIAGGSSVVTSGIDTSGKGFGDVYGTVTGGSIAPADGALGQTISGCTVTKQGGGSIAADSLKNFVIRHTGANTRLLGTGADTNISFGRIVSNSSGTSGVSGMSIDIEGTDPPLGKHPGLLYSGTMELRRVKTYMNVPGSGPDDVLLSGSVATIAGGPRFVQTQPAGGWVWGIQRRAGTGAYQNDTVLAEDFTGIYGGINRLFTQVQGPASGVAPSAIQGLIDNGYSWDNTVVGSSSNAATRVGPDWSKQYLDHGQVVFDNRSGGSMPEFASFYANGVGGAQYPHPLITNSVVLPPVINSSLTSSATIGTNFSYTITATNSPFSFSAAILPAGFTVNTTTGVISCLAANNVGQPGVYSITITAHNSGGTDTETFTLTLTGLPITQRGKGRARRIGAMSRRI